MSEADEWDRMVADLNTTIGRLEAKLAERENECNRWYTRFRDCLKQLAAARADLEEIEKQVEDIHSEAFYGRPVLGSLVCLKISIKAKLEESSEKKGQDNK
jgi:chromosome segregation ATPase